MLRLTVASPCTESWASMQGDERARHCAKCRLTVHNVANLSEAEVRALFSTGGRVCARLYQRADGTVLTQDCPVGLVNWLDPAVSMTMGDVAIAVPPAPAGTK